MNKEEIKAIVENIFLASDEPVSADRLVETIQDGVSRKVFQEVILELREDYEMRNLQIIEVAEGFILSTRQDYADWIKKFFRLNRQARLSQPALDTLSIIAYKQPITRAEVEEIRGVDSSGVVKTLLEKNVITAAGRKSVAGRPMMFKTTRKFLDYFGLKDLSDLPTLEDLKEADIVGDHLDASNMQAKLMFEDARNGKLPKLLEPGREKPEAKTNTVKEIYHNYEKDSPSSQSEKLSANSEESVEKSES